MIKILDFYATWCRPCALIEPTLKELQEEYDYITVQKVNIDEDDELTNEYKIKGVPTLLLFKDEVLVDKSVGNISKQSLLKLINKHEFRN